MNTKNNLFIKSLRICIMLFVGGFATAVFAQQGKVISSYGPVNQTETFE